MNTFQTKLYTELMALCAERDLFYFKDHKLDGLNYRVFSYHMGSYTDFCQPSALECRGPLFLMNDDITDAVDLVSLPQPKIFNWTENPFTMNVDFDKVIGFEEKADGSLINTYMHNGQLRLKSKTSLTSIMALAAMTLVNNKSELHDALRYYADRGITTIMEWCDPDPASRIVLFYEEPQLRIFGMRSTITGEDIDYRSDNVAYLLDAGLIDPVDPKTNHYLEVLRDHSVDQFDMTGAEAHKFAESVGYQTGVEGYVMVLNDGQRIKIKTQWYVTQHRLKDSVTNEEALFKAVISGSSDDLKGIFHDNPGAVKVILEMEDYAIPLFKDFVNGVEEYYKANKDVDRKSYAIKGQQELSKAQFGCAMSLYLATKEVDYVATVIKQTKNFVADFKGKLLMVESE